MGTIAQQVAAVIGEAATRPWGQLPPPQQQSILGAIAPGDPPACLAQPETTEALIALMTTAHDEGWRLLPMGHGSKLAWGHPVAPVDVVITTAGLNRILDHAVGDLTVTVEAGVPFADLEAHLAQTGQTLGLDPAYPDRATLGGIVATADTGSLRQRYGGVRDRVIGLSLVRHDGQGAKAGGRVVKNVAGYDLMKLMTGAYGTLGLISQLTLRTYPQPEASKTLLIQGDAVAIAALAATVRRSPLTPVALDLLSPGLLMAIGQETPTYGLVAQFRSMAAGVAEQAAALVQLADSPVLTTTHLTDGGERDLWQRLGSALYPPTQDTTGVLLKVGLLPTAALALLTHLTEQLGAGVRGRIHASSGIGEVWLPTVPTAALLAAVRSRCQNEGGYCTVLAAPIDLKQGFDPWGLSPDTRRLMAKLQEQFDPQQRLSPQRWGPALTP
ncbi:MAG: FAD-binding oxidoreductase [Cyanobacteria bacterium]|nr:FAD-binding oxidoreductase [Cyanobacteriota bacterium]